MNSFEAWEIEEELQKLKAQMRNPQAQVNPPDAQYTPPTSDSKTKKKYLSQEIEEELEQLKAQMRNPQAQVNTRYTAPTSDNNQVYYEALEIKSGASKDETKQAYKRLVKKWHPDLFFNQPRMQLQAQEKFKKINEAYTRLSG